MVLTDIQPLRKSALPLYLQVRDLVMRKILSQEWRPGEQLPTDRELSALLGINHITLGKALNMLRDEGFLVRTRGNGTFVAERQAGAASHANPVRRDIAVLYDELNPDTFSSDLFAGIFTAMDALNLSMHLFDVENSGEKQADMLLDLFRSGKFDGAIVWSVMDEIQIRRIFQEKPDDFPLVFLDRLSGGFKVDWSGQDDYRAGWLLGDLMKRRGLKRGIVLQITESTSLSTEQRRVCGFSDAFGGLVAIKLIDNDELGLASVQTVIHEIAADADTVPTVLFSTSDVSAHYVYRLLKNDAVLRNKLSFCYIQGQFVLPVSRVYMNLRDMGTGAVKILQERLNGNRSRQLIYESNCELIEV